MTKWVWLVVVFAVIGHAEENPWRNELMDQVGNGGKAVVCRNAANHINSIQVLDFYESKILYNLEPKFVAGNYLDKVAEAISRLEFLDSKRTAYYRNLLAHFLDNTRFVPAPLIDTPDSDHIIAPPSGCQVEQVAIQMRPMFPGDRIYTINQETWANLDDDNKAGLVLHEFIYTDAILRGHRNSVAVRYFNAQMSSGSIRILPPSEYVSLLKATRLGTYHWNDTLTGNNWAFVDGMGSMLVAAKDACDKLGLGRLPTAQDLELHGARLVKSAIGELLARSEFVETWTRTRRAEDGFMAIGSWNADGIQVFFRHPGSDLANIVCFKPNQGGVSW